MGPGLVCLLGLHRKITILPTFLFLKEVVSIFNLYLIITTKSTTKTLLSLDLKDGRANAIKIIHTRLEGLVEVQGHVLVSTWPS